MEPGGSTALGPGGSRGAQPRAWGDLQGGPAPLTPENEKNLGKEGVEFGGAHAPYRAPEIPCLFALTFSHKNDPWRGPLWGPLQARGWAARKGAWAPSAAPRPGAGPLRSP